MRLLAQTNGVARQFERGGTVKAGSAVLRKPGPQGEQQGENAGNQEIARDPGIEL